jgi:hypothetical protein
MPKLQRADFLQRVRQTFARQRKAKHQFRQLDAVDPVRIAMPEVAAIHARHFIADHAHRALHQKHRLPLQ